VLCTKLTVAGGRKNVLPGTVRGSIYGFGGQHIYELMDEWHTKQSLKPEQEERPIWKQILQSRWMPGKLLSDEEYRDILKEKKLRLDVEIAVIDDNIAELRQQHEAEQKVVTSEL
jgi:hypothetical protein